METLATPENIWAMIHSYVKWCLEREGIKDEKYTLKIEPKEIDFIIEEVERIVHYADEFEDWIDYCDFDKWRACRTYGASYFVSIKDTVEEWVVVDIEDRVASLRCESDGERVQCDCYGVRACECDPSNHQ